MRIIQRSRELFGFLLLVACGAPNKALQSVTIRDSTGVEIVENSGDLWSTPPRWQLSAVPLLRIGTVAGEAPYIFDRIVGIVELSDGRIVVANRRTGVLRWFDAQGKFLFERGGLGSGPGEFTRLSAMLRANGDSLIATDGLGARVTMFGSDGSLGPILKINGIAAPPGGVQRLESGALVIGPGTGFSTAQLGENPKPGITRLYSPILLVAADGSQVDTVGMFPGSDILVGGPNNRSIGPVYYAKNLSYAVATDRIYVGTAERLQVDVYTMDGKLVRSIRAPNAMLSMTPEREAELKNHLIAQIPKGTAEERANAERGIAQLILPPTIPAYASVMIDDAGNLWLGEYRFDLTSSRRFLIFDADGRFTTVISVPERFTPMFIAGSRILGRITDSLDVQYVTAFAIER